jgi:hypothetical protein
MKLLSVDQELLPYLYDIEVGVSGLFAGIGYAFSPVLIAGQIADPGLYNLPGTTPVSTESVTYTAAGVPVSDTYTETRCGICSPMRAASRQPRRRTTS